MEKLKVLIVDDEPLARERVRDLLAGDNEIGEVFEAANGLEAVKWLETSVPDILFLDIQMPHLNGFQALEKIGKEKARQIPAIVFITAYDQHALQAFEFYALDYLLKPFARERFTETSSRAKNQVAKFNGENGNEQVVDLLEELTGKPKYLKWITVKKNDRILLYRTEEVQWLGANANYVLLQFEENSELIRETMDSMEKQLDPQTFIRIHRSTIVNINFIKEIQVWFNNEYRILMKSGKMLTLTNTYRERFMKFFKQHS